MSELPADWLERLRGVPELAHARVPETGTTPARAQPPADGGRQSAVLMLFSDGHGSGGPDVLLTERSRTLRSHAGQVSFPGGGIDSSDDGAVGAALREAQEETGVEPSGIDVLGLLPSMFLPPSGYHVTPVLAWWRAASVIGPVDVAEVASVVRAPLAELVDPANRLRARHPSGYVGPAFRVQGLYVWGFTASLLSEVLRMAELELAWDGLAVEDLPADVMALLA